MKTFNPLYSKRGGLGVLALFCSLFVFVLLTFLFWPSSELVAEPTGVVESVPEVVLSEPVIIPVISGNITKTGAVSLDEPRPKISPELVKELKELKRERKRAKVLINVRDDAALVALQKTVSDAGGQITQSFSVGDVAVVDLPADKVEEVSQAVGVEEISNEREYVAFLSDRIPVFGVDKVWETNITGKNVKIAVLDTGVGPHDNVSVYDARSFVSGEDTADLNGHGTHVAGIAQGVASGVQIYNAKVLSKTGSGSTSQIIAGINWAADNDVDIISMSFGGMFTELDGPLASAVKDAIQRGVVFVVASGNCRQGCGGFFGVTTPGNVKEVITVGAVDDSNVVTSFSSGDSFSDYIKPDITAPGKDITSTWLNNGWKTLSGTSMSTPFVSGVVALMLEKESLTHAQVKARLEGTAVDLGTAGKDTSYGSGLVNVSFLIPVVVNVTINQTNATNTTIPVNETIPAPILNETNATETPANETSRNETTGNPNESDDNIVEDVDGYYVTVPVGEISSVQPEDAEICSEYESVDVNVQADEVREVRIKIPKNSTFYVYSGDVSASSDEQISSMATGQGYIDYDDSFTYQSSNNDGIVWGGISLDVGLDGEESGTKVICYDWCGDGNIDHCFADTSADFSSCTAKSTVLSGICSQSGKCVVGSRDGDHVIDTSSSGSKWTCSVDSRYYANCGSTSYKYYDISAKAYYVISPRQYDCNSNGGTYDDVGKYSTSSPSSQVRINKDLSCGTGKGCDESKDDSNADFGTSGTSTPSTPCSMLNGYGDCDSNSDHIPRAKQAVESNAVVWDLYWLLFLSTGHYCVTGVDSTMVWVYSGLSNAN